MTGILDALRDDKFECFGPTGVTENNEPFSSSSDSDSGPSPLGFRSMEEPCPKRQYIHLERISDMDPMLFRYFLDGSERVTDAGFVIDPRRRHLPLFIAQIGVATTYLKDGSLELLHYDSRNILFFPDSFSPEDLDAAARVACEAARTSKLPLDLGFERYPVGGIDHSSPMESARARILASMHKLEIDRISRLAKKGDVTRDALLLIDGSLAFYGDIDRHLKSFENVVGVAKSFQLYRNLGKGKNLRHVGTFISQMPCEHRSPAYCTKHRNLNIASWYLRLYSPNQIASLGHPSGVVKVEVFPEQPAGPSPKVATARCERISQHLLALRAPTTPSTDSRWASHLYPVHLTERYIKSRFRSDFTIKACL